MRNPGQALRSGSAVLDDEILLPQGRELRSVWTDGLANLRLGDPGFVVDLARGVTTAKYSGARGVRGAGGATAAHKSRPTKYLPDSSACQ